MMKKMLFLLLLLPLHAMAACDDWQPVEICTSNGELQQSYLDDQLQPPDYAWPVDRIDSEADLIDRIVKTRTFFMKNIHMEDSAVECTQTCDVFVPPPSPSIYECGDWGPGLTCDAQGNLLPIQLQEREAEGWWLDRTDWYQISTPSGMTNRKDFIFENPDAMLDILACSQDCALVDQCQAGESQGYLGICSAAANGPFQCGVWRGGPCHPETGDLIDEYAAHMLSAGFSYTGVTESIQIDVDRGFINKWRKLTFANKNDVVSTQICNLACLQIDHCSSGEVPDKIGICVKEKLTTMPEVAGIKVLLSESEAYRRPAEAAEAAALQIQTQGNPYLEYGAVIYRDRTRRGYVYSDLIEQSPGSIKYTATLVDSIESLKAEGHRVYGYVHTTDRLDGPTDADISYARFLRDAFRVSYFAAITPQYDLIRYTSSGYVYP